MTQALNDEWQSMVANSICYAADLAKLAIQEAALRFSAPSVLYRPALSKDGNQWCALYGENLQDGVAGFGDTPEQAMADFDRAWGAQQ
jgi:hypothetical protein